MTKRDLHKLRRAILAQRGLMAQIAAEANVVQHVVSMVLSGKRKSARVLELARRRVNDVQT